MVTSRAVRPKKKVLEPVIETVDKVKKTPTIDKILAILKENPKGMIISHIGYATGIKSTGNLYNSIQYLLFKKQIMKETCPHCSHTELYKLVI